MMNNIQNVIRLFLITIFASTIIVNVGCHEESRKVNMGGLFSIAGNCATLGTASKAALEIAIEDINAFYRGNEKI